MTLFEQWLIDDIEKQSRSTKKIFLRMLKFEPARVLVSISTNLIDWATQFVAEKGKAVSYLPDDDTVAKSILASWQEQYKAELEAIK
ncbi:MAG: hypothetical protein WC711_01130 [Candidatus Staskawiczbacteria bacterium]|jgi:hypothetical protein